MNYNQTHTVCHDYSINLLINSLVRIQLLPSFTHSGYDYFCTLELLSSSSALRTSTFLFVEPRFRYPFLSPLPHDSQAWESLLGSPVAGAHGGLTPQMYDMPVVRQKNEHFRTRSLCINY